MNVGSSGLLPELAYTMIGSGDIDTFIWNYHDLKTYARVPEHPKSQNFLGGRGWVPTEPPRRSHLMAAAN